LFSIDSCHLKTNKASIFLPKLIFEISNFSNVMRLDMFRKITNNALLKQVGFGKFIVPVIENN
jgi:hypothetical protein